MRFDFQQKQWRPIIKHIFFSVLITFIHWVNYLYNPFLKKNYNI